MEYKPVHLVETHDGTVFSNTIWNLSFPTGHLPHLLYEINSVDYLNSSFKFSCIPIGQQVNRTLISSVLLQSLIQKFGCLNGGG